MSPADRDALLSGIPRIEGPRLHRGDRVAITVEDVTATGTIGPMASGWTTINGINNYLVVLDGTGQRITVNVRHLERIDS